MPSGNDLWFLTPPTSPKLTDLHAVAFVRGYLPVQRENGSEPRRVQDACIAEVQDEPLNPCIYLVLYDRLEGSCVT